MRVYTHHPQASNCGVGW